MENTASPGARLLIPSFRYAFDHISAGGKKGNSDPPARNCPSERRMRAIDRRLLIIAFRKDGAS